MSSTIRYHGHDKNKIKKDSNDVYKKILNILLTDELFTSLEYDKLEEEFKYEWKFHIRKELVDHIDLSNMWMENITPYNTLKIYKTNLCEGKIFIRSIIVPKVKDNEIDKKTVRTINKFKYQLNIEVGIYNDDGYKSYVLEDVYESSN